MLILMLVLMLMLMLMLKLKLLVPASRKTREHNNKEHEGIDDNKGVKGTKRRGKRRKKD